MGDVLFYDTRNLRSYCWSFVRIIAAPTSLIIRSIELPCRHRRLPDDVRHPFLKQHLHNSAIPRLQQHSADGVAVTLIVAIDQPPVRLRVGAIAKRPIFFGP